ncbi:hypothetical protein [Cellulophaga sp. Ld12]|uniref:hypothetical protein n=1 Tax=Cellulophaga sp. Ld12 TaxID=3229535 RepID=UPI0038655A3B
MKTYRWIVCLTIFLLTSSVISQEINNTEIDMKVTEFGVVVNSLEELDGLNWNEYFSIFDENKEDADIKMFFKINELIFNKKSNHAIQELNSINHIAISNLEFSVSGLKSEKKMLIQKIENYLNSVKEIIRLSLGN